MVQMRSILEVADNSGAKRIAMILPLGATQGRARVLAMLSRPRSKRLPRRHGQEKQVVKAVIVRTRKEVRRKDGTYIRFDQNAAVLIKPDGEPVGTRVFGPVARELRERGFTKIVSLAPEVI